MTDTQLLKKDQEVGADSNIGDRAKPDLVIDGVGGQLGEHKGRLDENRVHYKLIEEDISYQDLLKQITDGYVAYLFQTSDPFAKKFLEALREDPSLLTHFNSVTGLFRSPIPGVLGIEEQTSPDVEEEIAYDVEEYIIQNYGRATGLSDTEPPLKVSSER